MSAIDATNFREAVHGAIAKYRQESMVIDALLWSHLVALYEDEIRRASAPRGPTPEEDAVLRAAHAYRNAAPEDYSRLLGAIGSAADRLPKAAP